MNQQLQVYNKNPQHTYTTYTYTYTSISTGTRSGNRRGRGHDYFDITTPTKKLLPVLFHTVLVVPLQAHHPQVIVDGVALVVVVHGLGAGLRHVTASRRLAKLREPSCRLGSKDSDPAPSGTSMALHWSSNCAEGKIEQN